MSDEVRASHLLVKHQGSRRPASWRDPDGQHIPKKTKEAARDELLAYREQIASGVAHLHRQTPAILHRDLKSLNILLDHDWNAKVSRAETPTCVGGSN